MRASGQFHFHRVSGESMVLRGRRTPEGFLAALRVISIQTHEHNHET